MFVGHAQKYHLQFFCIAHKPLLNDVTKCSFINTSYFFIQVILAPSPKYTGMVDDPPRYMGEGFVIMSSNNVELYTYMDEPGTFFFNFVIFFLFILICETLVCYYIF